MNIVGNNITLRKLAATIAVLFFLTVFLFPLFYGISTAFKTEKYMSETDAPMYPAKPGTREYEGRDYSVYELREAESVSAVIILQKGRESSTLLKIDEAGAEPFTWDGRWRTLKQVWKFHLNWPNFKEAWQTIDFTRLLVNTFLYAAIATIAMVSSSALVAFGFARFRFPFKGGAFMILIATMILPPSVTLIPTYAFFHKIGLVGTWLPLILPAFFAHAYNVFLLRQFFMGIPRQMDEAAKMDGANYFMIFLRIILPQAIPALIAVGMFHFFYCWNDFFGPLIYLAGNPDKFPISIGLSSFMNMFKEQTNLIQAASLIATVFPFLVFLFFQKIFIRGVVISAPEK